MEHDAEAVIHLLGLTPHPEGGHYRELYRSAEEHPAAALPARYGGARAYGTGIYYLLRAGERSRFHRIKSDEIWHHYQGCPVALHLLHGDGGYQRAVLGPPPRGDGWQVAIPQGVWFAAEVLDDAGYALVGCTVAPGFEYADFELADGAALRARYPQHAALIDRLT